MRLRTFTAPTMPAAMEMVREQLGENAVILSTGKHNGVSVSVTAAVDTRDEMENADRIAVGDIPPPIGGWVNRNPLCDCLN